MKHILLSLLLLAFSPAVAQSGVEVGDNGLAPSPNAWTESQHFELFEALTLSDLGLRGPVETVLTKVFVVEGNGEPHSRQFNLGVEGYVSTLHVFDGEGWLREGQQLNEADEPGVIYRYQVENGIYLGYERLRRRGDSDEWVLVETLDRLVLTEREVLVRWQTPDEIEAGVYRILYDDQGRIVSETKYDEDGVLLNRTTYKYEDGRLVERSDGTDTTIYEYNPEGIAVGGGLVTASKHYSTAYFRVSNRDGELILENSDRHNLMRNGVDFYYHHNGSLAERRYYRVGYRRGGEPFRNYWRIESFENGLLRQETSLRGNVIAEVIMHEYGDELGLTSTTHWHYDQPGQVTVSRCDYLNFDRYGNWTKRQCTPTVGEEELQVVLETFRGRLTTRTITYY